MALGGHRERIAGYQTRIRVCGPGDDVAVFFPAVMDSPTSFGRLQLMLRRGMGGRVTTVAVELPGYAADGDGDGGVVPQFDRWPAFCVALCQWLEARFGGRFMFAGNSSGAVAATEAALVSRRCAGLALLCWSDWRVRAPHPDTLLCPQDAEGVLRLHHLAWSRPPTFDVERAGARVAEARRFRAHVASFDADRYRAALDRYGGPLLVVAGDADGLVSADDARATVARRPGASLSLLANCGHYPHREQPAALARALQGFMRNVFDPVSRGAATGHEKGRTNGSANRAGST